MSRNAVAFAPESGKRDGSRDASPHASRIAFDFTGANAMSVDVEEHFQVSAFETNIARSDWNELESRVARNVERILDLFAEKNALATFFTLGWVAERMPGMMRTIVAEGHEIASHGYDHRRVWTQSPEAFLEDVSRTRRILEDVSGEAVTGYRAPSFSIRKDTPWAYDMLQKAGYRYSSSVYPISHDHYGIPDAPRGPYRPAGSDFLEIPMTTVRVAGRNLPGAGGGYFRLLPTIYSRWSIRRANGGDRLPAMFYFHPWEIDHEQPRVAGISSLTRFRHYVNLSRFERRLGGILAEFRWDRIDRVYRTAIDVA